MEVARIIAAIAIGGVGLFFLASGFQGSETNWFGQWCYEFCIRPEWIAIGGMILAAAVFVWKMPWPPQSN
jgi:hypothetical protein